MAPLSWKKPDSACSRPRGGARRGPGSDCGSRRGPARRVGLPPAPSVSTDCATSVGRPCWETTRLSVTELRQLARLKQPLVRVRGQWVELHHGELSAAITAVGKRGATGDVMSAGEVLRSALGLEPGPGELPVVGRGGGRLARRPALRCRRPNARAHADARWIRRRAPALSRTRTRMAELFGRARSRGLPGRRHGTGQDGPASCAAGRRAGPSRPHSDGRQRSGASERLAERRDADWARRWCSAPCPWWGTGSARRLVSHRSWPCTSTTGRTGSRTRPSPSTRARWTWSCRPTVSPRVTWSCWPAFAGAGWFSTRHNRSRTAPPAPRRASGRFRPSGASP